MIKLLKYLKFNCEASASMVPSSHNLSSNLWRFNLPMFFNLSKPFFSVWANFHRSWPILWSKRASTRPYGSGPVLGLFFNHWPPATTYHDRTWWRFVEESDRDVISGVQVTFVGDAKVTFWRWLRKTGFEGDWRDLAGVATFFKFLVSFS